MLVAAVSAGAALPAAVLSPVQAGPSAPPSLRVEVIADGAPPYDRLDTGPRDGRVRAGDSVLYRVEARPGSRPARAVRLSLTASPDAELAAGRGREGRWRRGPVAYDLGDLRGRRRVEARLRVPRGASSVTLRAALSESGGPPVVTRERTVRVVGPVSAMSRPSRPGGPPGPGETPEGFMSELLSGLAEAGPAYGAPAWPHASHGDVGIGDLVQERPAPRPGGDTEGRPRGAAPGSPGRPSMPPLPHLPIRPPRPAVPAPAPLPGLGELRPPVPPRVKPPAGPALPLVAPTGQAPIGRSPIVTSVEPDRSDPTPGRRLIAFTTAAVRSPVTVAVAILLLLLLLTLQPRLRRDPRQAP
ncbi:hypothetical protein D5H75_11375 [Bailinhaonella thermotolerans]|uniref:DUF11 domain-containing protein n=1 Tax=Bailinhaonella thermotolerans TaxID=1070861 RepID=A0A3A4B7B0_9ACTN|nr:hypothetical protein D5H75_11375 [Bailinhaonella thermotolerans]